MKDFPKVSVAMITYNHEKYINEAIESVMKQSYPNIELIISDDCSNDRTSEIIKMYKDKYPSKIRVLDNKQNLGMQKNFMQTLKACDGKYIALLEGDDAWINENKIQVQVDFLENNHEFFICSHRAKVLNELNANFPAYIPDLTLTKGEVSFEQLLSGLFLPTASVVFRNYNLDFPSWYEKYLCMDRALHLLNARHGKIYYIDQTYSMYRTHENGVWSSIKHEKELEILEDKISMIEDYNLYTKNKYKSSIEKALNRYHLQRILFCTNNVESYQTRLNELRATIEELKEKIDHVTKERNIYIFGAGTAGISALNFLEYIGVDVKGIVDNDPKKRLQSLQEKIIINFEKDFVNLDRPFFIIASVFYDAISTQLNNKGLNLHQDYIDILNF
ncbi:glycosyltransferase [Lysinibacillus pakistanensis]|uniref:Glycosyltransferase n=1 Tax=Lysinibacillus pakistanensis TaxID=759811 RepID=A0ABX6D5W0_9BACI|nr:glycosyltransferase [Lysinibacillus pakistanensis]